MDAGAVPVTNDRSQKAPSAKRCIKTRIEKVIRPLKEPVRKHRAPKGALRQGDFALSEPLVVESQKAPSAKRCIKTVCCVSHCGFTFCVRKHRAPKGALRRPRRRRGTPTAPSRQKAPSAKRCIKTVCKRTRTGRTPWGSESTERQKVH